MTHLDFQVALVEGLIAGYEEPQTRKGIELEIMKSIYFNMGFKYVNCHFTH